MISTLKSFVIFAAPQADWGSNHGANSQRPPERDAHGSDDAGRNRRLDKCTGCGRAQAAKATCQQYAQDRREGRQKGRGRPRGLMFTAGVAMPPPETKNALVDENKTCTLCVSKRCA